MPDWNTIFLILPVAAALTFLGWAFSRWHRLRGTRVVACPETGKSAAVELDAGKGALRGLAGNSRLTLRDCTRWPERGDCGARFEKIRWHDHKPALVDAEGVTAAWKDFPPDRIPDVLSSHRPVCWNCHVAETFRRKYPRLVTDRPSPREGASDGRLRGG